MEGVISPTPSPVRRQMLCPVSDCPLGIDGRESDRALYPSVRPGKEGAACGLENARLDSNAS